MKGGACAPTPPPLDPRLSFYTDGSKDTERVSVAAVLINHSYGHRIQDHSSIFTAEARAILLALECIEHSNRKRFLIFTDSMSCLQALDHLKIDHPIIEEIISKLTSLKASGFDIHLCWPKRCAEPTCSPVSSHPRILNPSFANISPPRGRTRGTSHH